MLLHLQTALFLILPLVVAGALHMLVVRRDWFSILRRPIDEATFGANKTWRGFVVMPLATVLGVWLTKLLEVRSGWHVLVSLQGVSPWLLGVGLGIGYVLFELPNSYVKRRLAIAPGMLPERNRFFFAFVDQTDSVAGCAVAYVLVLDLAPTTLVLMCLLGPGVHLITNLTLYCVGLRARPI